MRSRSELLAAIHGRLAQAVVDEELSGIMTTGASAEARELEAIAESESDTEAVCTLGIFHWFRYLALPENADADELCCASRFLAPEALLSALDRYFQCGDKEYVQ